MATAARQNKGPRKGPAEPTPARAANRTPAWGTGARASPTFSPPGVPGRPSPSQSPPNAQGPATQSFPPLAGAPTPAQQQNGATVPRTEAQRVLQSLTGLTGTTVTLLTKTGQRLEGVVGSVAAPSAAEGEGVTLKDVKDVNIAGAPLRETYFVPATQIDNYTSGPADARPTATNGDTFRTDTDISTGARKVPPRERDLQAWVPTGDAGTPLAHGGLDDETFGPSANGTSGNLGAGGKTSWDQFSANEQLFGVRASFDEEVYTTKLDRSAPDFKEREKKAAKLASEIIGATTNNPHIAEERGIVVDDSGVNEEDKYGAVVRGQNAYVPPGARRSGFPPTQATASSPPAASSTATSAALATTDATKVEVPKVAVNGPDGSSVTTQSQSPASSKAASPAPTAGNKPPADPLPAFRDFVKDEKQRLTQKRQALVKNDMDKRMADLVKFSQNFKLNKPIPEDLVPILAKDEERQRQIKEKARVDAASAHARAIGPSTPTQASRGVAVKGVPSSQVKTAAANSKTALSATPATAGKPPSQALAGKGGAGAAAAAAVAAAGTVKAAPSPTPSTKPASSSSTAAGTKKISMVIQSIPPFRGGARTAATTPAKTPATGNGTPPAMAATPNRQAHTNGSNGAPALTMNTNLPNRSPRGTPMSPNTLAAKQLNAQASSFRPNPKVVASPKNGPAPPSATLPPNSAHTSHSASPKPKISDSPSGPPNPFFGTRLVKKSTPVHLKDDFNPFKHNKVVDASQVSAMWPYSGKRYAQMFPPPPSHPPAQHGGQMMPPMPPPIPPPTYEEDTAAQAAAQQQQQHRGYVYAYQPYGYPPQHMMPGMAPPGPPGPYMQGPYMQMGPYPPGMGPPNAMYPPMGQMPPPQAYMQPPPGAYPPPSNGAGPRPSMPPTPIPAHAHPYYHQSPQLQHAYPMMMPPPPNIPPPHGYEGGPAPPVPMGGHA